MQKVARKKATVQSKRGPRVGEKTVKEALQGKQKKDGEENARRHSILSKKAKWSKTKKR